MCGAPALAFVVGPALVADRAAFVGAAPAQVRTLADRVAAIVAQHPGAAAYSPAPIL